MCGSLHVQARVCSSLNRYHDKVLSEVMLLFLRRTVVTSPGQTNAGHEHERGAAVNTHYAARLLPLLQIQLINAGKGDGEGHIWMCMKQKNGKSPKGGREQ